MALTRCALPHAVSVTHYVAFALPPAVAVTHWVAFVLPHAVPVTHCLAFAPKGQLTGPHCSCHQAEACPILNFTNMICQHGLIPLGCSSRACGSHVAMAMAWHVQMWSNMPHRPYGQFSPWQGLCDRECCFDCRVCCCCCVPWDQRK